MKRQPISKVDRLIVGRELTDPKDPKRRIVISFGMPRRVSAMEWHCNIRIEGLAPKPILERASGVDSLQALLLGVEFVRSSLKRSRRRLAWLGDSSLFPAGGIPRQVPADYGEEFDNRIKQLINREEQRFRKFRATILRSYLTGATKKGTTSRKRTSKPRNRVQGLRQHEQEIK